MWELSARHHPFDLDNQRYDEEFIRPGMGSSVRAMNKANSSKFDQSKAIISIESVQKSWNQFPGSVKSTESFATTGIKPRRNLCTVPIVGGSFEKGFQQGSKTNCKRLIKSRALEQGYDVLDSGSSAKAVPVVNSFLISKYDLKKRYDVTEIHRKVCRHCKKEHSACNSMGDVNFNSLYQTICKYDEVDEAFLTSNLALLQGKEFGCKGGSEAGSIWPIEQDQKRRQIVVRLPRMLSEKPLEIEDVDEIPARPVFSYTHAKR